MPDEPLCRTEEAERVEAAMQETLEYEMPSVLTPPGSSSSPCMACQCEEPDD